MRVKILGSDRIAKLVHFRFTAMSVQILNSIQIHAENLPMTVEYVDTGEKAIVPAFKLDLETGSLWMMNALGE